MSAALDWKMVKSGKNIQIVEKALTNQSRLIDVVRFCIYNNSNGVSYQTPFFFWWRAWWQGLIRLYVYFLLSQAYPNISNLQVTQNHRDYLYTSHISCEGHSRQSFPAFQLCEVRLQYHFLTRLRLNTQALHNYVWMTSYQVTYLLFILCWIFWAFPTRTRERFLPLRL